MAGSSCLFSFVGALSVPYGVGPSDIGIFQGIALVLVAVASIANWIPARRAPRIHPGTALRYE